MTEQTANALPPVVDQEVWQASPTYSSWLDSPQAARLNGAHDDAVSRPARSAGV